MRADLLRTAVCFLLLGLLLRSNGIAAESAKEFIFENSRSHIVNKAREEGKLRVLSGLDSTKHVVEAFSKKYPFIEVEAEHITGTEAAERFVLELKAGVVKDWDVLSVTTDMYGEYLPYLKAFDLVSMAKKEVLRIPVGMIDPKNRNVVGMTSSVSVVSYNKSLIPADRVPDRWEDFLKPPFKGRKFAVDLRPHPYTAMIPAMGLEWVLNYCRKLAAQEPIWLRGQSRALTAMAAGDLALHAAINYHSTVRAMHKDPTGNLQYKLIEPVPVRLSEPQAVFRGAAHPYSALLWLEFVAGREGQQLIDEHEPLKSSVFGSSSVVEKLVRGKKLSVFDWDTFHLKPKWTDLVVEAFGFPQAEKIKKR